MQYEMLSKQIELPTLVPEVTYITQDSFLHGLDNMDAISFADVKEKVPNKAKNSMPLFSPH